MVYLTLLLQFGIKYEVECYDTILAYDYVFFSNSGVCFLGGNMKVLSKINIYLTYVPFVLVMIICTQSICYATGGSGIITDSTLPEIMLSGGSEVYLEAGSQYVDEGATAIDNIDGNLTDSIVTNNPVNVYLPGIYTITYNVHDEAGNDALEITRAVNVIDTTPPVITLIGDAIIFHNAGSIYNDEGATAFDFMDGDLTEDIIIDNPVDGFLPGSYTILYNVQDGAENAAVGIKRTVNVVDTTPPVITLVGNVEISLIVDDVFIDPGATALDDIDGDISESIVVSGFVDCSIIGSYEIHYNVIDKSENSALNILRVVNVVDKEKHVPVAFDGALTVDENAESFGLLFAEDGDGDTLSYSIVTNGNKGIVTILDPSKGDYTYSPYNNENGIDTFTFRVSDGLFNSDIATITVTINIDGHVYNRPPDQPEPYFPDDGSINTSLQPELKIYAFCDPDFGDTHAKTMWQISTDSDFLSLTLERESSKRLTSVVVPVAILEENTQYFWRVKFYDDHLVESEWSEIYSFITINDYRNDENLNGIPDDQDVDSDIDMDKDGFPDIIQNDIMSLSNTATQTQIGIKGLTNIVAFQSIEFVDLKDSIDVSRFGHMPFGFVGFKLRTYNPGDTVTIQIYFSEKVPEEALWYKYDEVSGLMDYSDNVFFSEDNLSILIDIKDGGYGDADGTINSVIVDPGGVLIPLAGKITDEANDDDKDGSNTFIVGKISEEVDGCFIGIVTD